MMNSQLAVSLAFHLLMVSNSYAIRNEKPPDTIFLSEKAISFSVFLLCILDEILLESGLLSLSNLNL